MVCWNCRRYNRNDRRCLDGKANPRRKSDSIAVAEMLGVQALCHYNKHREPLAMRMFFTHDKETIQASARRRKRAPHGAVISSEMTAEDAASAAEPDASRGNQ